MSSSGRVKMHFKPLMWQHCTSHFIVLYTVQFSIITQLSF